MKIFVQRFACIFFQVCARNAYYLSEPVYVDLHFAVTNNRKFILTYLITLGEVRIEIVLAREYRMPIDFGTNRKPKLDGHTRRFHVHYR